MATSITKFDRSTLRNLRDEMQALLESYGVQTNLEFSVGNMSFSEAEVNIKVAAKVKGATTQVDRILQMEADRLGLDMENAQGEKLVSYKTRARKTPFIWSSPDGKMYRTDERGIQARFSA